MTFKEGAAAFRVEQKNILVIHRNPLDEPLLFEVAEVTLADFDSRITQVAQVALRVLLEMRRQTTTCECRSRSGDSRQHGRGTNSRSGPRGRSRSREKTSRESDGAASTFAVARGSVTIARRPDRFCRREVLLNWDDDPLLARPLPDHESRHRGRERLDREDRSRAWNNPLSEQFNG